MTSKSQVYDDHLLQSRRADAAMSDLQRAMGAVDRKEPMTKAKLLDAAKEAVADRGLNYGKPEDNFQRIACLWKCHFLNKGMKTIEITPADVAMMMILMKIARLENTPAHMDSIVDMAGYAACMAEIVSNSA